MIPGSFLALSPLLTIEALTIAGAVYVARWPIQVFCLAAAVHGFRAGRRRVASAWAAGGVLALVAPYVVAVLATPLSARTKTAVALLILTGAAVAIQRRVKRRIATETTTAGSS